MQKINFNKQQKLMMLALPAMLIFNPLFVEIFIDWFKLVFTGFFLIAVAYIAYFMLTATFKTEKVNIPKKSQRTQKAGKFLEV